MILPRPVLWGDNWSSSIISRLPGVKFNFELVKPSRHAGWRLLFTGLNVHAKICYASVHGNPRKGNEIKIGLMDFYCHSKVDFFDGLDERLLIENYKWKPIDYLTMGENGIRNLDLICELWSKNGELIPNLSTEIGKQLREQFDKLNRFTKAPETEKEALEVMNLIDKELEYFGTYLDALIITSRLNGNIPINS